MKILTKAIEKQLLKNHEIQMKAQENDSYVDLKPVVKIFNPAGGQTWLLTEMAPDGTCFGLCDLGLGCPELGYVLIWDLLAIRNRFGGKLERDMYFTADKTIREYADEAMAKGYIDV